MQGVGVGGGWNEEYSEADNYLEIDFKYAIAYMSAWIWEKSNINS